MDWKQKYYASLYDNNTKPSSKEMTHAETLDWVMDYYDELYHYRTPGSKNGQRLYQYKDGSWTPLGRLRYGGPGNKRMSKDDPDYAEASAQAYNYLRKLGSSNLGPEEVADAARDVRLDPAKIEGTYESQAKAEKIAKGIAKAQTKVDSENVESDNKSGNTTSKSDSQDKRSDFEKRRDAAVEEYNTKNNELNAEVSRIRENRDKKIEEIRSKYADSDGRVTDPEGISALRKVNEEANNEFHKIRDQREANADDMRSKIGLSKEESSEGVKKIKNNQEKETLDEAAEALSRKDKNASDKQKIEEAKKLVEAKKREKQAEENKKLEEEAHERAEKEKKEAEKKRQEEERIKEQNAKEREENKKAREKEEKEAHERAEKEKKEAEKKRKEEEKDSGKKKELTPEEQAKRSKQIDKALGSMKNIGEGVDKATQGLGKLVDVAERNRKQKAIRNSDAYQYTNQELDAKIARMQKEYTYNEWKYNKQTSRGAEVAKNVLDTIGGVAVTAGAVAGVALTIKKLLGK